MHQTKKPDQAPLPDDVDQSAEVLGVGEFMSRHPSFINPKYVALIEEGNDAIEERASDIVGRLGELGVNIPVPEGESIFDTNVKDFKDDDRKSAIKDLILAIAHASDMADNVREYHRPNHRNIETRRDVYEVYVYPYLLIGQSQELKPDEKRAFISVLAGVTRVIPPSRRDMIDIISRVRQEIVEIEAELQVDRGPTDPKYKKDSTKPDEDVRVAN